MNIVDILIGFVGGGAIGGGALYALQEGKIREALQKQEKIRADLGETEAELEDTKGELKRLELSQERMGNIEATYREKVAKLQKELEDSQGRLQEAAGANPVPAIEVAYKTQIQELEQEYETKIEELRQSYQSQIREIIDGKQAEMEALRQSQQVRILELENGYQWQIQQLEQSYQSQLLELQNDTQTIQPGEEINPFDGFITEENLDLAAEFTPEMEMFDEEEETRMIGSLEELSGNYDQSYSQETVGSDTGFPDLLATDSEKFAAAPNSLDDLFADITDSDSPELFDPFAAETPEVESNGKNVASVPSYQEELDFFSMWDDEGVRDLESLPSEEEFPLDDLFSDDLFSDGDNTKTTMPESHQ